MPLFVPEQYADVADLTVSLSRLLFPIIVLLGMTGMVVGILNSYDRFGAYAIAPFFWNVVIIAVLVGLAPAFPEEDEIYAYAIGVLAGTVVQLAILFWDLKNTPFGLRRAFARPRQLQPRGLARLERCGAILVLMLPVTISLGLININLVINSSIGFLVSEEAPAAIDKAFRIYMLPQGIFSVAIATVLFPTLARFAARSDFDRLRATMANGTRQILLLLVPAAASILVLAEPMTRLVYERGVFDAQSTDLVSEALFWFAFSLPFCGVFLLQTRTFFSLQRPWVPTAGRRRRTSSSPRPWHFSSTSRTGSAGSSPPPASRPSRASWSAVRSSTAPLGGSSSCQLIWSGTRILASRSPPGRRLLLHLGRARRGARAAASAGRSSSLGVALAAGAIVYGVALTLFRVPEMGQVLQLFRRRES